MWQWTGAKDFFLAQCQVAVVLAIAYVGNNWPQSYHRNENHDPNMFWVMNGALLLAGLVTLKHDSRGVQLLSRAQTEEWKGWMQWAFIMYHYYRMYSAYNEIRVFVSAYVWMTGFGNFLYFDKKQDYSLERGVSMWLRINYFPLLLSTFIQVPLELYYVVPLHTVGFFVAMATCYLSTCLASCTKWSATKRNLVAIFVCLLVHIAFYESPAVDFLKLFSDEYHFRFQSDKYSAWVGILSGFVWFKFKEYMQWCYGGEQQNMKQILAMWGQRIGGALLIGLWYGLFGHFSDKYIYNPVHPYIFWMPVAGFLMLRNSSKYLTELHMAAMEFFGRITLETYVLQFHVFMSQKVQHIPIVFPGSGPDGTWWAKTANMLLCGTIFVSLAFWARQITITTQTTVTELVGLLWRGPKPPKSQQGNGVELNGPDGTWWAKTANMLLCGTIFVSLASWTRQITITTQTTVTELVGLLWRGPKPPKSQQGNGVELNRKTSENPNKEEEETKSLVQNAEISSSPASGEANLQQV